MIGFPHTCHPSYGDLAFTPAGLIFLLNMLAFIGHTEFRYTKGWLGFRLHTAISNASKTRSRASVG